MASIPVSSTPGSLAPSSAPGFAPDATGSVNGARPALEGSVAFSGLLENERAAERGLFLDALRHRGLAASGRDEASDVEWLVGAWSAPEGGALYLALQTKTGNAYVGRSVSEVVDQV